MDDDSDAEEERGQSEDEDTDLSMVLAMLIRSGQLRLASGQGFLRNYDDSEGSETDEASAATDEGLQEPDCMKDSYLMQDLILSSGKFHSPVSLNQNVASVLLNREIGCCGFQMNKSSIPSSKAVFYNVHLPSNVVKTVNHPEKNFCGIFSQDGSTFLSACQDGNLRVYNTHKFGNRGHLKPFKVVRAIDVGWSILDVAFSPDALYAAYSTWSSHIHVASIYDNNDIALTSHSALDLQPGDHSFAVFSLQFSGDNSEILCGANDGDLYIYDRNLGRRTSRISAHEDDVNAIRFADKSSQILYSGGDDGLINVWDRRMLRENNSRRVGCFASHHDGITFIDSKEDTRYLLSNSKDQTIKIWDMRKFSPKESEDAVKQAVSHQAWDYRWQCVPRRQRRKKKTVPGDTSIKTYRGHTVTRTLIRAKFSPMHSTGQRYIYCGSSDGKLVIYDIISGDIVSEKCRHKECVRDVSWHPYEPMIISSSWDRSFKVWGNGNCSDPGKSGRKRNRTDNEESNGLIRQGMPYRRSPRLTS